MKRHIGWSGLSGLLLLLGLVSFVAAQQPSPGGMLRVALTLVPTMAANRAGFLQMSPASQ
jgi:hypothetical protein